MLDTSSFSLYYLYTPSAPEGRPRNVTASVINSTSTDIYWTEMNCLEQNGDITGYTVHYRPVIPKHPAPLMTLRIAKKSLIVTNLIPRTNYIFQVHAENANGSGPSANITITTDAVKSEQLIFIQIISA